MKRFFLTISIIIIYVCTIAQSKEIVIGKIDTVYSKILNEKRPVWIYIPQNETNSSKNDKKYPVLYLLDGDWHFCSVVGMLQQLSYINGNTICPEMIVVGIPSKDRFHDYTPSCDTNISKTSGAYKEFISFMKNELIPYIDSTYPVTSYKMLTGHSLGGLTVINTLIQDPKLFNSYVAIDPSMWWDNQISLKEAQKALSEKKFENIDLYLAIANSMDKGMDTIKVKKDATRNTLHIRSILALSGLLNSNRQNKLNYKTKYYENENHGSVPLMATYDALHFIFDFYNLPLTKKDYADTSLTLAYRIENHYTTISKKMGCTIYPSENTINTLAYSALMMKSYRLAGYFFELNIKNYPDSYNAFDSYGDYFMATGNKDKAAEMYKKSLSKYENLETRQKLENIR